MNMKHQHQYNKKKPWRMVKKLVPILTMALGILVLMYVGKVHWRKWIQAQNRGPTNESSNSKKVTADSCQTTPPSPAAFQQLLHTAAFPLSVPEWNMVRRDLVRKVWKRAYRLPVKVGQQMSRRAIYSLFPPTMECDRNDLFRLGGGGDGGKWVCGGDHFPSRGAAQPAASLRGSKCVVISVGSDGNFEFERAVVERSGGTCQVHTLDCTGQWNSPDPANIHFHPWCLSSHDHVQELRTVAANGAYVSEKRIHKSWTSVLKELELPDEQPIALLKMDVEGYEWSILPHLLASSSESDPQSTHRQLPLQILVELHFFPPRFVESNLAHLRDGVPSNVYQPLGTPSDMIAADGLDYLHPAIRLFQLLDQAGYQVASTEYNRLSVEECCQEFTFVRMLPRNPGIGTDVMA